MFAVSVRINSRSGMSLLNNNVRVQVNNITDFKDSSGQWIRVYSPSPYTVHTTRASCVWHNINTRCKVGSSKQAKHNSYIGCTNGFKDFQELAEWCQSQYGYRNKESNGKFWQLDKDLKIQGNKVYSPDTCIFVPNRVNSLLISCDSSRGSTPLGVSLFRRTGQFQVRCSGVPKHLGYFNCEFEAHRTWQKSKVKVIRKICSDDSEILAHTELVHILLTQAQRIEDDLLNNRETK